MKKSLLVMLLALLAFFMFLGISQAGQCIYIVSSEGKNYYYDPSEVSYSGDTVLFTLYEGTCSSEAEWYDLEIDCAKRMIFDWWGDKGWESISPGSVDDTLRIKLCR
jgi:hypothetical protein